MSTYQELSDKELLSVSGGSYYQWPSTAFPNPYNRPNPYEMAMGGTTFLATGYGGCPGNSYSVGYVGGGTHLCRKR